MAWLRSYLAEPGIPNPPRRVWRDWAIVVAAAIGTVLEFLLRADAEWETMSETWQAVSMLSILGVAPAVLMRRTRPLFATALAFGVPTAFTVVGTIVNGVPAGVNSVAILLLCPYALYRWGSGRDGLIGIPILLAAGVLGNVFDASTVGEVIGGFIVLSIPVEAGLIVRYRSVARAQAIAEVRSNEREVLARELHDTVAHHVSAIAVQAQAGRAVASTNPGAALDVLVVIEEAASRTLDEMRSMVGALRNGADAELVPQQGVADIARLKRQLPRGLELDVDLTRANLPLPRAVDAALYRIAQESVTNAARHAVGATKVCVAVTTDSAAARLTVSDNGRLASGSATTGFGLLGMAERANLLGGTFDAGPNATGWQVVAELPLVPAEQSAGDQPPVTQPEVGGALR